MSFRHILQSRIILQPEGFCYLGKSLECGRGKTELDHWILEIRTHFAREKLQSSWKYFKIAEIPFIFNMSENVIWNLVRLDCENIMHQIYQIVNSRCHIACKLDWRKITQLSDFSRKRLQLHIIGHDLSVCTVGWIYWPWRHLTVKIFILVPSLA